jgi:hypothetical protein
LKSEPHPTDVQRDLDDSDQAILAALEDSQSASVRELSRLTHLPSTTVSGRLTQSLGFVARHLRWVPHGLSDAQKGERVNLSRQLLQMLKVQGDQAWHDIVTLDDFWFYLNTDYEFVWLPRDEKVPERERHTIQSKKFMLTIIWNPHRLSQWRSTEAAGNERKLLVHADNARPHTVKLSTQYFNENRMKLAPHPHTPYSPDAASSDFDLFRYVKRCLTGLSFEDADQLLVAVKSVPEGIEKVTLQAVFLE